MMSRRKKDGKWYYIEYFYPGRAGARKRVKKVHINGELLNWQVGKWYKKGGKLVHGVKFTYENVKEVFDIDGKKRPHARRMEKIVDLPKNATDIHITCRKEEVRPAYIEILGD